MTPTARSPAAAARPRVLSLFDVVCLAVNATIGSGVFALPDDLARAMGGWSPLAFLLCAGLLLPVALCFAELAGRTDETGGAYVYARRAFGDHIGFVVGWYCWTNSFVSWAACTRLFVALVSMHLAGVWPTLLSPNLQRFLAVAVIAALGLVNYFGVKPAARLVGLVVLVKVCAILSFIAVAVFAAHPSRLGGAVPMGIAGVGQGIYIALFPLQGFEVAPVTAGETSNPKRNVPLAIVFTLVFSALVFVIVQAVLVGSYAQLTTPSEEPLADAARSLGPRIGAVVLLGSLVSIGGFSAGSALGAPRYAEAIAAHGLLPAPLARIHPRWSTPHIAIATTTGMAAMLALAFDFRELVGMSNITVVIQYLFACLSVPMLRREKAAASVRGWVIPGGPVVPIVGAGSALCLFAAANRAEFFFAGATLVAGIGIAYLTKTSAIRR